MLLFDAGLYELRADLFHSLSRPVDRPISNTSFHFHVSPRPQMAWAEGFGKWRLDKSPAKGPPYVLHKGSKPIKLVYPDVHDQNFQTIWPKAKSPEWRTLRRSTGWYGGQYDPHARLSGPDPKELSARINLGHGKRMLLMDAKNIQSTTASYRNHRVQDEFRIFSPGSECAGMWEPEFEIAGAATPSIFDAVWCMMHLLTVELSYQPQCFT